MAASLTAIVLHRSDCPSRPQGIMSRRNPKSRAVSSGYTVSGGERNICYIASGAAPLFSAHSDTIARMVCDATWDRTRKVPRVGRGGVRTLRYALGDEAIGTTVVRRSVADDSCSNWLATPADPV